MPRTCRVLDNRTTVLADHDDTEGRCGLLDTLSPAGFDSGLHRHTRYSENYYVLEGELTVWLEGASARRSLGRNAVSAVRRTGTEGDNDEEFVQRVAE